MLVLQILLILPGLFRSADVPTRQRYVGLVDSVKVAGGTVRSRNHTTFIMHELSFSVSTQNVFQFSCFW